MHTDIDSVLSAFVSRCIIVHPRALHGLRGGGGGMKSGGPSSESSSCSCGCAPPEDSEDPAGATAAPLLLGLGGFLWVPGEPCVGGLVQVGPPLCGGVPCGGSVGIPPTEGPLRTHGASSGGEVGDVGGDCRGGSRPPPAPPCTPAASPTCTPGKGGEVSSVGELPGTLQTGPFLRGSGLRRGGSGGNEPGGEGGETHGSFSESST